MFFFWSAVPFRTAKTFTSRFHQTHTHTHRHTPTYTHIIISLWDSPLIAPDFRNSFGFMTKAVSSENKNWQAHLHCMLIKLHSSACVEGISQRSTWLNVRVSCDFGYIQITTEEQQAPTTWEKSLSSSTLLDLLPPILPSPTFSFSIMGWNMNL